MNYYLIESRRINLDLRSLLFIRLLNLPRINFSFENSLSTPASVALAEMIRVTVLLMAFILSSPLREFQISVVGMFLHFHKYSSRSGLNIHVANCSGITEASTPKSVARAIKESRAVSKTDAFSCGGIVTPTSSNWTSCPGRILL